MVRKNRQQNNFADIGLLVLCVYLFSVTAVYLVIGAAAIFPPLFLYSLVCCFAVYAAYRIIKMGSNRLLVGTLLGASIIATLLVFPWPISYLLNAVGIKCRVFLGGTAPCVNNVTFEKLDVAIYLLVPMGIVLLYYIYKSRR